MRNEKNNIKFKEYSNRIMKLVEKQREHGLNKQESLELRKECQAMIEKIDCHLNDKKRKSFLRICSEIIQQINETKKTKELHQRIAGYSLFSFLSFMIILIVISYFLPNSAIPILNTIALLVGSAFTLSAAVTLTIVAIKQRWLTKVQKQKRELFWYVIMMLFVIGAATLLGILAFNLPV